MDWMAFLPITFHGPSCSQDCLSPNKIIKLRTIAFYLANRYLHVYLSFYVSFC